MGKKIWSIFGRAAVKAGKGLVKLGKWALDDPAQTIAIIQAARKVREGSKK